MRFRKLRPSACIKILSVLILSGIIYFAIDRKSRNRLFPYFDTRCIEYRQKDFSRKLNDMVISYGPEAKRTGIKVCDDEKDLLLRIAEGKLVRVSTGRLYVIDRMTYSSPYLTKDGKKLLNEIAVRFRKKVSSKGLKGVRIVVTSMTRKKENVKKLRRNNTNSSDNSPHLYGNAFDISYKRILARKWVLTNCDRKYLKDALGEVIWELRQEGKCWATYERMQNCFHVVAR